MNVRSTSNGTRTPWGWYLLLVVPFIAILWVPFYSSVDPAFLGIPYFYWYQFLWIFISAVLTAIVYFATHEREVVTRNDRPTPVEDFH